MTRQPCSLAATRMAAARSASDVPTGAEWGVGGIFRIASLSAACAVGGPTPESISKRIDNAKELSVLDIGGGTGWLLKVIRDIDPRVRFTQVVDIDEKAKTIAETDGHSYFQGRIEEFPSDRKFDLILMLNLIEHVADPKAVMLKIEKLLNKGGLVLMKTPNIDSLDARLFKNIYWGGLHCPRHWVLFSENSFRYMISSTELKVQTLKYTQGAPFWAYSVMAWMAKHNWIALSKEKAIIYHPIFMPLGAFFAGLDFLRGIFSKTSQMFIILTKET